MSSSVEPVGALQGRRVWVTAQRRAEELGAALERQGAEVTHAAVLSTIDHADDAALVAATRAVIAAQPDVVVGTTGVGFRGWLEAADAAGLGEDLRSVLRRARLVARGPKTNGAIRAAGLTADWVAGSETMAEVESMLLSERLAGQRIAVQHHGTGSDGLDEALQAAGAAVIPLIVYRSGPAPDPAAVESAITRLLAGSFAAVVFTSAPAVHSLLTVAEALGERENVVSVLRDSGIVNACVGPVTSAPLEALGIPVLVPERFRMGALVKDLVRRLGAHD